MKRQLNIALAKRRDLGYHATIKIPAPRADDIGGNYGRLAWT
jgi:hypothetical protein